MWSKEPQNLLNTFAFAFFSNFILHFSMKLSPLPSGMSKLHTQYPWISSAKNVCKKLMRWIHWTVYLFLVFRFFPDNIWAIINIKSCELKAFLELNLAKWPLAMSCLWCNSDWSHLHCKSVLLSLRVSNNSLSYPRHLFSSPQEHVSVAELCFSWTWHRIGHVSAASTSNIYK